MSDQGNVNEAEVGQRSIPVDDYNKLVEVANKYDKTNIDPSSVDYHTNDGVLNSTLPRNTIIVDFPFRMQEYDGNTLSVFIGSWVRNTIAVKLYDGGLGHLDPDNEDKLLITLDEIIEGGDPTIIIEKNTDIYVYVELDEDLGATGGWSFNAAIIPGKLNLYINTDAEEAGAKNPDYVGTHPAADSTIFVKTREIIGIIQLQENVETASGWMISKIKQRVNIDIKDSGFITDADNQNILTKPNKRYTLEYNTVLDPMETGTNQHYGELQIYNVDRCSGYKAKSIPYFDSFTDNWTTVGPEGFIDWAGIDSHYKPQNPSTHSTLEIWEDANVDNYSSPGNPFNVIGLKGATSTVASSYSVPYFSSDIADAGGQMQGELLWSTIDSNTNGTAQWSIEVQAGNNYLQLIEFHTDVSTPLLATDMILFRNVDGAGDRVLKYCDANDIGDWLETSGGLDCDWVRSCLDIVDCDDVWYCITDDPKNTHRLLSDIKEGNPSGINYKNDHGAYWMNGDADSGEAGGTDDTYLHNWGSSIGSATDNEVISLSGQILKGNTGDWTVAALQKFLVENTIAATKAGSTGALKVTGGAWVGASLDVTGSIWASALIDAGTSITAGTSVNAGTYVDATTYVSAGSYVEATTYVNSVGSSFKSNGTQVVGAQAVAIADAAVTASAVGAGGADSDGVARTEIDKLVTDVTDVTTQLNDLLAKLRTHGLINV